MFFPNKIIVHHSATEDSGTVSWLAIRKYHVYDLGWRDIGYHAGVELVKTGDHEHYEILYGRPWNQDGAHTIGQNDQALGLCVVGNYDAAAPPRAALEAAARILAEWMRLFHIPASAIHRHSEFNPKSCPGSRFDLEVLRGMLA
jgi:hypothetical protein